jgi:hypothetical protein
MWNNDINMVSKSKTKKKLLPRPNSAIHLKDDGYSTHKSDILRRRALTKSSQKHGSLTIMRRLNLIRNLSKKGSRQKEIMSKDVEYLKKKYSKSRKSSRK